MCPGWLPASEPVRESEDPPSRLSGTKTALPGNGELAGGFVFF